MSSSCQAYGVTVKTIENAIEVADNIAIDYSKGQIERYRREVGFNFTTREWSVKYVMDEDEIESPSDFGSRFFVVFVNSDTGKTSYFGGH